MDSSHDWQIDNTMSHVNEVFLRATLNDEYGNVIHGVYNLCAHLHINVLFRGLHRI